MGALSGTVAATLAGSQYKLIVVTATLGSASDTITLTQADTGCQSIAGVVGATLTGGMDANLTALQVSVSGLVITIVSKGADGGAATNWDSGTVSIAVLGAL